MESTSPSLAARPGVLHAKIRNFYLHRQAAAGETELMSLVLRIDGARKQGHLEMKRKIGQQSLVSAIVLTVAVEKSLKEAVARRRHWLLYQSILSSQHQAIPLAEARCSMVRDRRMKEVVLLDDVVLGPIIAW